MDYVVRGANCYFDTFNAWRVIDELTPPDLKRAMDKFVAGGSSLGVEFPEEFEAIKASIKLKSDDPRIRGLCGNEPGNYTTLTWYENLTSYRNGSNKGRVITLKGLISEVKGDARKGLKAPGTTYEFSTVVFYQDLVAGSVVHQFDYLTGPGATIINGASPFAALSANLAIGGGTVL